LRPLTVIGQHCRWLTVHGRVLYLGQIWGQHSCLTYSWKQEAFYQLWLLYGTLQSHKFCTKVYTLCLKIDLNTDCDVAYQSTFCVPFVTLPYIQYVNCLHTTHVQSVMLHACLCTVIYIANQHIYHLWHCAIVYVLSVMLQTYVQSNLC